MERKQLKKANGDIFFEAYRKPDNSCIYVNWIGLQTLESIVMGSNVVLSMLKEKPCQGLLNSNQELIGPWENAVSYLAYKWAPAARALGLRNFAHVLSPGIFGRRSYDLFSQHIKGVLHARAFEDDELAHEWLLLYQM